MQRKGKHIKIKRTCTGREEDTDENASSKHRQGTDENGNVSSCAWPKNVLVGARLRFAAFAVNMKKNRPPQICSQTFG